MRKQQIKKLLNLMKKNENDDILSENFWSGANVVNKIQERLGLVEEGKLITEFPISLFDSVSFKTWKEGK